jgi:hypothetical protein
MANIEKDYRKAVHFKPSEYNSNVRCLNGSAHISRTLDINQVTCEKCLNESTYKDYWGNFFKELREGKIYIN